MTEFKMDVILLGFSVKFVWRNCSSSLLDAVETNIHQPYVKIIGAIQKYNGYFIIMYFCLEITLLLPICYVNNNEFLLNLCKYYYI